MFSSVQCAAAPTGRQAYETKPIASRRRKARLEAQRNRDDNGASRRIGQATIRVRFGAIEVDAVPGPEHVFFRLIVYRERAFEDVHEFGAFVEMFAGFLRIALREVGYVSGHGFLHRAEGQDLEEVAGNRAIDGLGKAQPFSGANDREDTLRAFPK